LHGHGRHEQDQRDHERDEHERHEHVRRRVQLRNDERGTGEVEMTEREEAKRAARAVVRGSKRRGA
jgi:hypothetical protein